MKKQLSKPGTFQAVLVIWLVISVLYIMRDMWENGVSATYQMGYENGYQNGYQKAFANVISKSQECQPFNIYVGDTGVDIINMACLQAAAAQAEASQAQSPQNAVSTAEQ